MDKRLTRRGRAIVAFYRRVEAARRAALRLGRLGRDDPEPGDASPKYGISDEFFAGIAADAFGAAWQMRQLLIMFESEIPAVGVKGTRGERP